MTSKSLTERALIALKEMEAKLASAKLERTSPIAVIGYGCRFPLSDSPNSYWKNLIDGIDCIQPIPAKRWKTVVDETKKNLGKEVAGLIDDVDQFDANFFGISPREAKSMDPQQRVLLEVSWEALESAGIQHDKLLGSNTGIFIGAVALDYRDRFVNMLPASLSTYALTGNLLSIISGRLAYILGTEGPCLTVETACSSSLVAIHQACQSLRAGETDLAIAGGVNLLLSPLNMDMLAQANTLASDGRCKTFDAKADGLVRGEGCGILILKKLADAQRDKDPIVAVIRETSINHDGRASSLSAPNVLSQQALLSKSLKNAGIKAEQIGYIETHGTGTALGDPIEFQALKEIFGHSRENGYTCVLGSVKSNIGHLESASGIAGLIKAILILENEAIPPQLHFGTLNPNINLDGTPFVIPTKIIPWQRSEAYCRIAGVNSFGISGTNAHVIIEEAPKTESIERECDENRPYSIVLSAKTTESLDSLAQKYLAELVGDKATLRQKPLNLIAYTASLRRSHYKYRLAITASNHDELHELLLAYIQKIPNSSLAVGEYRSHKQRKLAFVFPGLGSQWVGMGCDLIDKDKNFYNAIMSCDAAIKREAGWSVLDKLKMTNDTLQLQSVSIIQPLLFAVSLGLSAVWRAWGITPNAVVGHSMGEIVAAHIAGIIDLETAIHIVCCRSKLMEQLRDQGALAIVEASWEDVLELIKPYHGRISFAGSNSPRLSLLSGEIAALEELWKTCHKQRIFFRMIKDSIPSHSSLVDPLIPELRQQLSNINTHVGIIPLYSTVQEGVIDHKKCDAEYWINNLRQPVLFEQAISKMIEDGFTTFIELSPHPTLLPSIKDIALQKDADIAVLSSLRQGCLDYRAMLESLGHIYVLGAMPSWMKFHAQNSRYVTLPSYPWQHKSYWVDAPKKEYSTLNASDYDDATTSEEDTLYLRVDWQQAPLEQSTPFVKATGSWLLLANEDSYASRIKFLLESRGDQVTYINVTKLNVASPTCFDEIVEKQFKSSQTCLGVIYMLNMDASSTETTDHAIDFSMIGCGTILHLVQAISRLGLRNTPQLFLVTQNVQAVGSNQSVNGVLQSPVWGMAQVLHYEMPELNCCCIDLGAYNVEEESKLVVNELLGGGQDKQVAFRTEGRFIAKLLRGLPRLFYQVESSIVAQKNKFRANSTYLITGGLGGLGLELAKWAADQGAGALVLLSRSGADTPDKIAAIEQLKAKGTLVKTPQVDVSSFSQLFALFEEIKGSLPPLRGVIHAAGVLSDGLIQQQTFEQFQQVFEPKVAGAWNLHRLTQQMELDYFILYSSASAMIGSPGQSNYAAANAFLDSLAYYRKTKKLPALSISWGAFIDVGLAAIDTNRAARLEHRGMAGLTIQDGLKTLSRLMDSQIINIGMAPLDIRQWTEFYPQIASSSYLAELLKNAPKVLSTKNNLMQMLHSIPLEDWLANIVEFVQKQISIVLQQDLAKLDIHASFRSFGMDSLAGLELRNRLEGALSQRFSATLIWTYPNISSLAHYLFSQVSQDKSEEKSKVKVKASEQTNKKSDLNLESYSEQELINYLKTELSL
jgi:acyl transferase domain-containing protein/acyl carrier protein